MSEDAACEEIKKSGMPDVLVAANLELYTLYKAGYAAEVTPVVEQITGKKPISFVQFAQDNADAFK